MGEDESKHIWPMAEDFYAAFGSGSSAKYIGKVMLMGWLWPRFGGCMCKVGAQENFIFLYSPTPNADCIAHAFPSRLPLKLRPRGLYIC